MFNLYRSTISSEIYHLWILMNSCETIGDARGKSLMSQQENLAPLEASEITLFTHICVSRRVVVGEPESSTYSNLLSPTTRRTHQGSALRGR